MLNLLIALAIGTLAACILMGVSLVRSLKRSTITAMPTFAVAHTVDASSAIERTLRFDPAAAIDELATLGFRPVGSLRFDLPSHTAIFSILLSPTGEAFAAVTPAHATICSDFDGKLVDTSSGRAGVAMPFQLNHAMKAGPTELVATHRATLERVGALTGRRPRLLTDASVMEVALDIEQCSLATFSAVQQFASPVVSILGRLLSTSGPSDQAIERWAARPDRWEPIAA